MNWIINNVNFNFYFQDSYNPEYDNPLLAELWARARAREKIFGGDITSKYISVNGKNPIDVLILPSDIGL